MGNIFSLAKEFIHMSFGEIENLLDSKYYEARMGAVSSWIFGPMTRRRLRATRGFVGFLSTTT